MYIATDKGPMKGWLHKIGRAEDNRCTCEESQHQNAAHLLKCREIGDGKGRSMEEVFGDEEWCRAVYDFLKLNTEE